MPKIVGYSERRHGQFVFGTPEWAQAAKTERWWKRWSCRQGQATFKGRSTMVILEGTGARRITQGTWWEIEGIDLVETIQFHPPSTVVTRILLWRGNTCGIVPKGGEVICTTSWLAYIDRLRALAGRRARDVDLDSLSELAKAELAIAVLSR